MEYLTIHNLVSLFKTHDRRANYGLICIKYIYNANFMSDLTNSNINLTICTISKHLFNLLKKSRPAQFDMKPLKICSLRKS